VVNTGINEQQAFKDYLKAYQTNPYNIAETPAKEDLRIQNLDIRNDNVIQSDQNETPTGLSLNGSSVDENVVSGTVIGKFSSTDPDAGNTFTYSLVGGDGSSDNSLFAITQNQLTINVSPDFETKSIYKIRVRTTDQDGLFLDKPLNITVNDINENPTELVLDGTSIDENVIVGKVVGNFNTADPDSNNTFTYSLISGAGSGDNDLFTIEEKNLKINVSPNFETKPSYNIRVRTTDQDGLFLDKPLNITVNDINENPTEQISAIYTGSPNADTLIAGRDFDGVNNIVFTGAGNDEVDVPFGGNLAGNNRIFTGSGDDIIYAGNGDRSFGDSGDDKFYATDAINYRVSGGAGNDIFYLGANGRALGGDGDDQFFVNESGGNLLSGGAGADKFWIANAGFPTSKNMISDFTPGIDVIRIGGISDVTQFSDLALIQQGNDTLVKVGMTDLISLMGVTTTTLSASNFVIV
jgi:Ca2+-binding RTX toxin-like protein